MTIKELSKYRQTVFEIQQLQDSITELEDTIIGASKISDVSVSKANNSNPTEKLGISLVNLKSKLNKKLDELIDEQTKIENFLETIEDNKIRIIIRSRFIDGKKWELIGNELHYDRTTPYYYLKKYLKGRAENEKKQDEN